MTPTDLALSLNIIIIIIIMMKICVKLSTPLNLDQYDGHVELDVSQEATSAYKIIDN